MAISDKLTYLNTTKTKIRDRLNDLGADLDTEDTFRSYADAIDGIYEDYPKITGEGESLSLDNTKQASMQIDYKGQTSQVTYTGKQLFDIETISSSNREYKRNNGFILTKGTNRTIQFNLPNSISAGTYTLSVKVVNSTLSSNSKFLVNFNGSGSTILGNVEILNNPTFTITSPIDNLYFFIASSESDGVKITIDDIMLEAGSSATNWQPYVGGIPSPNPSYPQPINVVSGDNYIDICGKNLLPNNATSQTINGITFTINSDKSITINGTANGRADLYIYGQSTDNGNYVKIPTGIYSIDTSKITNGKLFYMFREKTAGVTYATSNNSSAISLMSSQDCYFYGIVLGVENGTTLNNYTIYPMIEKSSTATTYEPYIGHSYPIYLGVENLLKYPYQDTTKTLNGITFTDNGNGTITANGTATANSTFSFVNSSFSWYEDIRKLLLNNECTLSGCPSGGSSSTYCVQLYGFNASGSGTLRDDGSGINLSQFVNENASFNISIFIASGTTLNNAIFKPMLEKGTKANSYTPYGVTPIELCKIGTYQDYIYKDNGVWYLHKEIGKVVLNGSETTRYDATNKVIIYEESNIRNYNADGKVYCNYYLGTANGGSANVNLNAWNGNSHNINIKNDSIANHNDFKTWLASNNTIVYYVLTTPTNTEITDTTLLEQLEESKLSYISQTNISQVNNDLSFILDVKALRGE